MSHEPLSAVDRTTAAVVREDLMNGLEAFAALAEMLVKDPGRWSAGVSRRAISVALLLIALVAAATQSWRSRARHLIERLELVAQLRQLSHPPARWAGA